MANELTESCVKSNKLFVIPKFRVLHTADGRKQQFAFVMPHPENFNHLDELIESVHGFAQDSLEGFGPLTKEDALLEGQKEGAGMPISHPSLIRSFPSTGIVTREKLDYLGSDSKALTEEHKVFMKKELDAACGLDEAHQAMYDIAYAFPNDIRRVMDRPLGCPVNHDWSRTGLSIVEPLTAEDVRRLNSFKKGTSNQCGHTDGLLDKKNAGIEWVSMLAPISGVAHLRYWPRSHLLTDRIVELTYRDPSCSKLVNKDVNGDVIKALLQQEAAQAENGVDDVTDYFDYDTAKLSPGDRMIFLPTWVHAGTCLDTDQSSINYRLHSYLVCPNKLFNPGNTSQSHKAYEMFLRGFHGRDYDLSSRHRAR